MNARVHVQPDILSSKLTPEEIHLLLHGNPDEIAVPNLPAVWYALYSSTSLPPCGAVAPSSSQPARPMRARAAHRARSRSRRSVRTGDMLS